MATPIDLNCVVQDDNTGSTDDKMSKCPSVEIINATKPVTNLANYPSSSGATKGRTISERDSTIDKPGGTGYRGKTKKSRTRLLLLHERCERSVAEETSPGCSVHAMEPRRRGVGEMLVRS